MALGIAVVALVACSTDDVTFRPMSVEDCAAQGDEDGNGAADCEDAACAAEAACAATCTDGKRDGAETDVDCGGGCPACADASICVANGDCGSGLCGAGRCVRLSSCKAILAAGYSTGDGIYNIDLDGASGAPPLRVKCDMTIDGGGWTRFNWASGAYPASTDPLGQTLEQCAFDVAICRGRIPASVTPTHFMVKDLGDGDHALWQFSASNAVSSAALGGLRDKTMICLTNAGVTWQPYAYTGTETFCGNGGEGGCDSFIYTDGVTCGTYSGWYTQMDGDGGCYSTAFKMGMPPTGYETMGCEIPESNYLDDGPSTLDDRAGELYYR